jgi:hypothetical protein
MPDADEIGPEPEIETVSVWVCGAFHATQSKEPDVGLAGTQF